MITMKTEEDKFGISPIKPASFYSSESDKIKLNWFCYELSIGIYDELKKDLGKKLRKYKIDDKAIAEFSIYASKKMKDVILQKLSGEIDMVSISYKMVDSYFPGLNDRLVNKMLSSISIAWDDQLSICETCPTRCISEKNAYCTMFDEGPY